MTDRPKPLLAVTGTWPAWAVEASLAGIASTLVIAFFMAYAAVTEKTSDGRLYAGLGAGALAVVVGLFKWLHAKARRRSWRVEFADDAIRFMNREGATPRVTVPWREIAWFSDHEAECVQLKLAGPISSLIDLQIPTGSESERVAVLGLFAARGIVRRD